MIRDDTYSSYPTGPNIVIQGGGVPIITGSLIINPATGQYYVGNSLTAQFTIKNKGNSSITFDILRVGGRLNGDNTCSNTGGVCSDFGPTVNALTLSAGQSYSYSGTFIPSQAGTYNFFPTYEISGKWNTSIPGNPGVTTSASITVQASTGTIVVNATLNGSAWTGSLNYNLNGPSGFSGAEVPLTFASITTGAYSVTYVGGGPTGSAPDTITPTPARQLTANSTTTFTFNFGNACVARAALGRTDTLPLSATTSGCGSPSATTTTISTSATKLTQGSLVSFVAKVQSTTGTPTGSVAFSDRGSALGTSILDNTGTAVLSSSSLLAGSHSITAVYGGNTDFSGSTSSAVVVTVTSVYPGIAVSPSSGTIAVTSFLKTGAGFTPNGTITQRVTYPDGEVDTVPRTVDSTGSYSYSVVYSNQVGPYHQTDTDNTSGQSSNQTSWPVLATAVNDFSLQPSPSSQSVSQSSSAGFAIETTTLSGSAQSVTFSVANVPTGLTASFIPTTVTSGGTSALTVSASSTAPTGTYTLTITGSGTSAIRTTQISVTVVQAATGPTVQLESTVVRFNSQAVGSISAPETVMLMNSGSGQLKITSIALAPGSDYILTFPSPIPSMLNSLVPFSFQVAFEPSRTGTLPGQILIYDNAPGSPQSVALTGTGTAALPTSATINVNATLNNVALPNGYGYGYSLTGPTSYTGGGAYTFSITPGTYTIAFTGSPGFLTLSSVTPCASQTVAAGGNVTFTLNFTAPDDFYGPSFMFPPGGGVTPQVVKAGSSGVYYIGTGQPAGNASTPITLSVFGSPTNSTPVFNPQPLYSAAGGTLTVGTTSTTPVGTYALSLSGTNSNGLTHAGNTSTLAVTAPPAQPVQLVSVSTGGVQANAASNVGLGATSADGRYVVFSTSSTNLVSGNTYAYRQVYVRDRQNGTTTPVSVASSGVLADSYSYGGSISADGRFAVFWSAADNLYPGSVLGTNGVYVHDLAQGATEREDVAGDGTQANGDTSYEAKISADGRFVIFESDATNLVPGVTGGQVYLRDRTTGTITLASAANDGTPANAGASGCAISADGRFIAFNSASTNLVSRSTNGLKETFIRDVQNGTTVLVSAANDGTPADSPVLDDNNGSFGPLAISADGRFVVFNSNATNLVSQSVDSSVSHVFVRDTQAQQTILADVDSVGTPLGGWCCFDYPAISADGRFVSFVAFLQVLVRDMVANKTTVVSLASDGSSGNASVNSSLTAMSPGGTTVTFVSDATNLAANDTNGVANAFAAQNPFLGSSYLQSLTLSSSSILGGSSVTGTITLSNPAPAGGATVAVWTNNAAAQVVGAIMVPAGATSAPVSISTSLVPTETVLTALASYNGGSAVAILTLEPTPELSVSPQTWAFGNQPVGTTSAAAIFSVSNPGTAPLNNVSVTLVSGQLIHVRDNSCGATLAAGSDCSFSVTFSPTAAGQQSDSLQIVYGSPASTQLVGLTGYGTMPSAGVAPSSLDFGSQSIQTTSIRTETLANTGAGPLANISASISGANAGDFSIYTDNCSGMTLPSNSNCAIAVAFSPGGSALRGAVLNIASNAPQSPQQVPLTGTGQAPLVSLSALGLSFGTQPLTTTGAAQKETITNTGTASLTFTTIAVTGDFAITASGATCSASTPVAAGSNCVINVTFTPTASGARSGSLTLTDNASGSPQVVALSGSGTAPLVITANSASMTYGGTAPTVTPVTAGL